MARAFNVNKGRDEHANHGEHTPRIALRNARRHQSRSGTNSTKQLQVAALTTPNTHHHVKDTDRHAKVRPQSFNKTGPNAVKSKRIIKRPQIYRREATAL